MHLSNRNKVFICYAREDIEKSSRIYGDLLNARIGVLWMDKKRLMVGQHWPNEIRGTINECRYFMPLFSRTWIEKTNGYFHNEFNYALEVSKRYGQDARFFIPVRLEDCPVRPELDDVERIDLFPESRWEDGIRTLIQIILHKPKAVAKAERFVKSGEIVTLYGNESRSFDEEELWYYWEEIPKRTIALTSNTEANPQFVAPVVHHDTVFTFRLKVRDAKGHDDSTIASITVEPF